ncbi:MAG: NHL repeat-containing protein [Deltaproteobacteria bacterium]|nr:NHL repeat-containing protein [Deltaproteobacteria bacterium]
MRVFARVLVLTASIAAVFVVVGCGELVVRSKADSAVAGAEGDAEANGRPGGDSSDGAVEAVDVDGGVGGRGDGMVGGDSGDDADAAPKDDAARDSDAAAGDRGQGLTARLSIDRVGTGSGHVASRPNGLDCGATCSAEFPDPSTVTLVAEPDANSTLVSWSVPECGADLECTVEVREQRVVSVRFDRRVHRLNVRLGGDGEGRVLSTTGEIDCGPTCDATFLSGSSVVLTADPGASDRFGGWSGACAGDLPACTLTIDRDLDVGAAFDRDRVSLSVSWTGDGQGVVQSSDERIACPPTCSASYAAGEQVVLTANPDPVTTVFDGWSGACAGKADCELTLDESSSVLARFNQTRLDLTVDGAGRGTVTILPGNTRCSQSCSLPFNTGTEVTLVAEPDGIDHFELFSGACSGSDPMCRATLEGRTSITARFRRPNPPVVNGQAADLVLGQPAFDTAVVNNPDLPGLAQMWTPRSCYADGIRLFVSDALNARVLVWNTEPTTNGAAATLLLGKPTDTPPIPATEPVWDNGDRELGPYIGGLVADESRLYVADSWNSRIAVWNSIPQSLTIPPPPLGFVLGQSSFSTAHRTTSASEYNKPRGVFFGAGGRMLVVDSQNNRVLIYNRAPSTLGMHPADGLLGQTAWDGDGVEPVTASSMNYPMDAFYDTGDDRLYVADTGNSRILVWNGIPTQLGAPADLILGQAGPSDHEPNRGGPAGRLTMRGPKGVMVHAGSLFVSDGPNHRILVWTPPPTRPNEPPTRVLGQSSFESTSFGATQSQFDPWGLCAAGPHLYVADHTQNRILRFALSP